MDPQSIRGSRTGVFVGEAPSEAGVAWTDDVEDLTGHELVGCMLSMIAHKLSYFFDFTGVYCTNTDTIYDRTIWIGWLTGHEYGNLT